MSPRYDENQPEGNDWTSVLLALLCVFVMAMLLFAAVGCRNYHPSSYYFPHEEAGDPEISDPFEYDRLCFEFACGPKCRKDKPRLHDICVPPGHSSDRPGKGKGHDKHD